MAYGTAFQLAQRDGLEVVGLTSPGNVAFCESLGCYDSVVTYDDIEQLDPAVPSVYIDFAGSVSLRLQVHSHVHGLTYSCSVGASHVQDLGGVGKLPGPRPVMFFAPAQVKKRVSEWARQGLNGRMVLAWNAFMVKVQAGDRAWIEVQQHAGPIATQALFLQLLAGSGDPRVGHIAGMRPV